MLDRVVGLLAVVPFTLGLAAAPAAPAGDVVFRFQDPEIVEASGLVAQDGLFLTTNDSGDTGRVFVVAPQEGITVGVTRWADEPTDVEALAPAGSSQVWVGDIGDNAATRDNVQVAKIQVGRGERTVEPTTYDLVYPGGARDAETLLVNPRNGRLLVVSKAIFGGSFYLAPKTLSATAPNTLRGVGNALPIATDGAFFTDGKHVIIRNYTTAAVYTYPRLEEIATFRLPAQQQGESIAVDDLNHVFVTSEGAQQAVLRVKLPASVRRAVAPVSTSPAPTSDAASSAGEPAAEPSTDTGDRWPWWLGGIGGVAIVVVLVRALRPR